MSGDILATAGSEIRENLVNHIFLLIVISLVILITAFISNYYSVKTCVTVCVSFNLHLFDLRTLPNR